MTKYFGSPAAFYFLLIIWAVFLIDLFIPGFSFNQLGIRPRSIDGLLGIAISPFLHGGIFHIISNSLPLIILPILVRFSVGKEHVLTVMILGALGSGIGTWVFGSNGVVVGASGVVYSLIGYLFARAYFSPSLRTWACALVSFILYSGSLISFFHFMPYISWAAHFWGFVAGIAAAGLWHKIDHSN